MSSHQQHISNRVYYRASHQPPYLRLDNNDNNDHEAAAAAPHPPVPPPLSAVPSNSRQAARRASGGMVLATPQEADAAAGGGTATGGHQQQPQQPQPSRSFQLLPRVTSTPGIHSTLQAHETTGYYPIHNNNIQSSASRTGASSSNPALSSAGGRHSTTPLAASNNTRRDARRVVPDWRLRDRMKTVGAGLIMALNVGTDPPDICKPHPCAVLQTWMDPRTVSRSKAKELIGERLEQQYAKWQLARTARPLKYRKALDPTVEEVRALCLQLRRQARNERVLLHYNGHGVPKPTDHGEIWVFDKNHTEYIPLSIADLRQWIGKPTMVVLDCSAAGILLPFWTAPVGGDESSSPASTPNHSTHRMRAATTATPTCDNMDAVASQWVRDTIVLCPCSEHEVLPMHPEFPADLFTSCLTTPIPIALRWFVRRNPASMKGLSFDISQVDRIPGKPNDRKTPLGELNWIFTAVTDSIAWNVLPKPLFQRLFRQDLLVASMFRNYLLADRILRSLGCTPQCHPPLPQGISSHALWQAWDLACETLLFQLQKDGVLGQNVMTSSNVPPNMPPPPAPSADEDEEGSTTGGPNHHNPAASTTVPPNHPQAASNTTVTTATSSISSPFFSEQLTAFEVWLEFAAIHKLNLASGKLESPEQLPVVLQVLLSQVHRIRALLLLRRFLDLGPWAVNLSLSLGIFPYVMKLLQSPEYKSLLVSIWASVLAFDPSCRVDLLKDGAFHHFVQHLMWGLGNNSGNGSNTDDQDVSVAQAAQERALAAFCLAAASHNYPAGQAECVRLNLHGNCCALLSSYEQGENTQDDAAERHLPAHFRQWLCLCLANLCKENGPMQNECYATGVHQRLAIRAHDASKQVRAAVCYALGCLVAAPQSQSTTPSSSRASSMNDLSHSVTTTGRSAFPGPNLYGGGASMMQQHQQQQQQQHANQSVVMGGQLQPSFGPSSMVPNMTSLGTQPTGGQAPLSSTGSPWGHPGVTTMGGPQGGAAPLQAPPYMMSGPTAMPSHASMGAFLGGGNPLLTGQPLVGGPPQHAQHHQQHQQLVPPSVVETRPMKPSVFEDRQRFELDLASMEILLKAAQDGSVMVRYEAVVALACAVHKYLEAFLIVAEELASGSSSGSANGEQQKRSSIELPRGLERKHAEKVRVAWERIRLLQHKDPFPAVAKAANDVVSVVHEHLLRNRLEQERTAAAGKNSDGVALHPKKLAIIMSGIDEELALQGLPLGAVASPPSGKPASARAMGTSQDKLRRVASETFSGRAHAAADEDSFPSFSSHGLLGGIDMDAGPVNYTLPKSEYYQWKKSTFDPNFEELHEDDPLDLDPLSPAGASKAYQDHRNYIVMENARKLKARYESLAPKPPEPTRRTIDILLTEDEQEKMLAAELDASQKKSELELKQTALLRNEGVTRTSIVDFHPYEDYLMACGVSAVSFWNTENGQRLVGFENGNPKDSRITTSCWINGASSSLFLIGCDDGTVRLWGDLMESNGEPSTKTSPSLVSAFDALPMEPGTRGSGLVCEWQPYSGNLLVGGNSKFIRCWDFEAEKQTSQLETNTDAYVTTLTTAWDFDELGMGQAPHGYQGIGRDVIVAGHSDGSLKIFDIRTKGATHDLRGGSRRRHKQRATQYSEHKSWVVTTAFTGYGSRYELISGTVAGDIKAWDLRMSSSIRTVEAQRSTLTALAVHSKLPVMATGSHAQFIKILTLDGDTMQVLRYHERMASHRIGPVSCLAFHPYKPLLAAGATDTYIGLYTPKNL